MKWHEASAHPSLKSLAQCIVVFLAEMETYRIVDDDAMLLTEDMLASSSASKRSKTNSGWVRRGPSAAAPRPPPPPPPAFDADDILDLPFGVTVRASNPPSHAAFVGTSANSNDRVNRADAEAEAAYSDPPPWDEAGDDDPTTAAAASAAASVVGDPHDGEDDEEGEDGEARVDAAELTADERADRADAAAADGPPQGTVDEVAPVPRPLDEQLTPAEFYFLFVSRDEDAVAREGAAPQRSVEWLAARMYCITASQFGAAVGNNSYQTSLDCLIDKLWGGFQGNAFTRWGTLHEPHAREAFERWFGAYLKRRYVAAGRDPALATFTFYEDGLLKRADVVKEDGTLELNAWIGVSPDGRVTYEDADGTHKHALIEFKCPASDAGLAKKGHPYGHYKNSVPLYYWDQASRFVSPAIRRAFDTSAFPHSAQVQGISAYLQPVFDFDEIFFIVWRPTDCYISRFAVDAVYGKELLDRLASFFFGALLPGFTHKYNGLLAKGEAEPARTVEINNSHDVYTKRAAQVLASVSGAAAAAKAAAPKKSAAAKPAPGRSAPPPELVLGALPDVSSILARIAAGAKA